jgi:hypothetical protein
MIEQMRNPIRAIKGAAFLFVAVGGILSCSSVVYSQAADGDVKLMEKYEKRSDELADEIKRTKKKIALNPTDSALVLRRDSLIVRKADVDKIKEDARKSAIENARRSQETSLMRRSK